MNKASSSLALVRPLGFLIVALTLWVPWLNAGAASKGNAYLTYIETYKDLAIQQMKKYHIPASITLAQGLLESAAGQSRLATKAHNHFGIKVSSDWKGGYMLFDDDAKNEKFRKYHKAADSYEDHSRFLQKPRYAALFKLSPTDYRGWARTLQKCGYATNPRYAESLISLIERYNLTQYDKGASKKSKSKNKGGYYYGEGEDFYSTHQIGMTNGLYYIVAQPGDDLKRVAKAVGKKKGKLRGYNEMTKAMDLTPGDIVYLSSKKSKAAKTMKGVPHVVREGETIHSISQLYGVKMESVYKKNGISPSQSIKVGDILFLR